uniref:(northern house mosquito) hypothetical protein n=1 Tax=Culex pipiens TaxID=7175 RepID=A0A8D8N545_CULPI
MSKLQSGAAILANDCSLSASLSSEMNLDRMYLRLANWKLKPPSVDVFWAVPLALAATEIGTETSLLPGGLHCRSVSSVSGEGSLGLDARLSSTRPGAGTKIEMAASELCSDCAGDGIWLAFFSFSAEINAAAFSTIKLFVCWDFL